jgi:hypothetical protein
VVCLCHCARTRICAVVCEFTHAVIRASMSTPTPTPTPNTGIPPSPLCPHTRTHTHARTHAHARTHTHTLTYAFSCLTLLACCLTYSVTSSLTYFFTESPPLNRSRNHAYTFPPVFHTNTHTNTHTHTQHHAHMHTQTTPPPHPPIRA